jgi:hypothetical protein
VTSYELLPTGAADATADDIVAGINRWITSEPMRDLVGAYDEKLPDSSTGDLLGWLDTFSATHWDFRAKKGVERDQVTEADIPDAVEILIPAVPAALGLIEARPPARSDYDHLLILGGLAPACLQRTAYAAHLVADGLTVTDAAALGSFRKLGEHETPLLDEDAAYEVDAMAVGVRRAFGFTEPVVRRGSDGPIDRLSWRIDTYRHPSGPRVDVLAAPAETGKDRANTPDTYKFWAETVKLHAGDQVLVVTSPIYVPFQHSDAIRMLGLTYRCAVETVGFDAQVPHGVPPVKPITADRYLQEIRSGIRSMKDLFTALSTR